MKTLKVELDPVFATHLEVAMRKAAQTLESEAASDVIQEDAATVEALRLGADAIKAAVVEAMRR